MAGETGLTEAREMEERLRFETLLAELSARFINLPAEAVDGEIIAAQRLVCERLGLDLSALWQWEGEEQKTLLLTHYHRDGNGPPVPERMDAETYFPWSRRQLLDGQLIAVCSTEELPAEAAIDQANWRHFGVKTSLTIPLAAGGTAIGTVSFNDMRAERAWSDTLIRRLKLVAQVFANALVRKRSEEALRESEERLGLAAESAGAGLWSMDLASGRYWLTQQAREMFGFGAEETVTLESVLETIQTEDRERVRQTVADVAESGGNGRAEYRVVRPGGGIRWMVSRGRIHDGTPGRPARLMGVTIDVTEQKLAENKLRNALDEVQRLRDELHKENLYLRQQIVREAGHGELVGESEPVKKMLALARRVAPTGSAVLITGETGTGKELLAQMIHDLGSRKGKAMVKVNCAALPAPLIEGELFGREKGAYTGAMTQQCGRFELANGSTIFLDEIGDLPLELQTKLLRVLQDGRFERLGSNRTLQTDCRVVAATNRDLVALVREGKFREDLFHRLNVFPIHAPPLRERVEDIPLLVWKFVQEFNTKMGRAIDSIPRQTMERIKCYPWPGNVRELRNLVERAMILSEGRSLQLELPDAGGGTAPGLETLEAVERNHIRTVLERTRWRISGKNGAADILGMVPTTLHSRMKKLGITRPTP